jgi:AcrR family transcriptional regulator
MFFCHIGNAESLKGRHPMPATSKKEYDKQVLKIRKIIIETAQKLFAEHGYNKTTFNKIAEESKIGRHYISSIFKNKKNLYKEAVSGTKDFSNKDIILLAAEKIFAEKGFKGASISQIAKMAGVSPTLPFYFFGLKGEIFTKCGQPIIEQIVTNLKIESEKSKTGYFALINITKAFISFAKANPVKAKLLIRWMPFELIDIDIDKEDPEYTTYAFIALNRMVSLISEVLLRGVQDESIPSSAVMKKDIQTHAYFITEMFLGAVRMAT